jgi:hypothetical protein|tara:strand:- start:1506 stop:2357 length:852 start_codon:yes stop_codon:yes gene_type:complete
MNNLVKKIFRTIKYLIIQRNVYGITSFIRVLPDFFVVGVVRSGTTSLYYYLDQHPCVMKSAYDELGFFDSNFDLGWNWYKSLFPTIMQKKKIEKRNGKFLTFDDTPFYVYNSTVVKRIKRNFPDAKIIVIFRNPIDRAYSNYFLGVNGGKEKRKFDDLIEEEMILINRRNKQVLFDETLSETYLGRGLYAEQLKVWFSEFPKDSVKIIKSEEFAENTQDVMKDLFQFLDLPEYKISNIEKKNVTKYPPMKKETREKLEEFFRSHNKELYNMLGKDFGWEKSRL